MKPTCSAPGCDEPAECKGFCGKHYMRDRRTGDPLGGGPERSPMKGLICSVATCDADAQKRGLCGMHYQRLRKTGTTDPRPEPTLEERFWSKVDRQGPEECWEWKAGRHTFGYGLFRLDGKQTGAHCIAWRLANGPIPEGLLVRHACDNPPCCNPAHLLVGTVADNVQDAIARGRWKPVGPHPRPGERHWNARLTADDVRAIRAAAAAGERHADIASRFGVSIAHVGDIKCRRTWAHVT